MQCMHEVKDFESYDTTLKCSKKNTVTYGCRGFSAKKCKDFKEKDMEKCKSCGKEKTEQELKGGLCEDCYSWDIKQKQFEELAKPFIEFMAENFHPHAHVVVDSMHAELSEGVMAIETEEFLRD